MVATISLIKYIKRKTNIGRSENTRTIYAIYVCFVMDNIYMFGLKKDIIIINETKSNFYSDTVNN